MKTESKPPGPAASATDRLLTQELRPKVNAIVKMAERLKTMTPGDATAQQISASARELLNLISRHSVEPDNDGSAIASQSNELWDVLYIEDDPRTFSAIRTLLKGQRG